MKFRGEISKLQQEPLPILVADDGGHSGLPIFRTRGRPHGVPEAARIRPGYFLRELFRAGTIGADRAWGTSVVIAVAWAVGLLLVAAVLHRRFNRVFVDLL